MSVMIPFLELVGQLVIVGLFVFGLRLTASALFGGR